MSTATVEPHLCALVAAPTESSPSPRRSEMMFPVAEAGSTISTSVGADDVALARAAAAGDDRALRRILERVTRKVRAIAWHMVYDHHEAQDLCQEALLKMTSRPTLAGYRGEGPLEGYLVSVGVRAMISARRPKSATQWRQHVRIDTVSEATLGVCEETPGRALDPRLIAALRALPERARTVVLLIAVGGYTYEETATITGLPIGTVRSAYHRARNALQRALASPPGELSRRPQSA